MAEYRPRYRASYHFDHSPELIFRILSDVEAMRLYMPLCKRSRIISREVDQTGAELVSANFLLRYRKFEYEQSLDLQFRFWPAERRMEVEELSATFGHGKSSLWVIDNGGVGSRLLFESNFRSKNLVARWFLDRRWILNGVEHIMERVRMRADDLESGRH